MLAYSSMQLAITHNVPLPMKGYYAVLTALALAGDDGRVREIIELLLHRGTVDTVCFNKLMFAYINATKYTVRTVSRVLCAPRRAPPDIRWDGCGMRRRRTTCSG
jgi:hypothetical protein